METISRVKKVGGSLVVRIPKDLAKEENIREGQIVKIEIKKVPVSGFGILKGIGPFTAEDELDTHE
ncbi:MAG: AbrB/MazE/SpoVT family DNA-binding domain-containing protein [Candidatus Aenigmarchaeota archaeon]|nr:AbrB/MazE/SpoVT family DNA-binding domain-containing protein [Candidatus Aenigmarchaeota archaeon]